MLKNLAAMDLEKINMDLLEDLLEWIVDGDHSYPPGLCVCVCIWISMYSKGMLHCCIKCTDRSYFNAVCVCLCVCVCVNRCSAGVSTWHG